MIEYTQTTFSPGYTVVSKDASQEEIERIKKAHPDNPIYMYVGNGELVEYEPKTFSKNEKQLFGRKNPKDLT